MSTYTYDPTDTVGKIRLLIGDTDIVPTTDAHFSDEEITAFWTMATDMFSGQAAIYEGAALVLESWASIVSESIVSETIGDYKYNIGTGSGKSLADIKLGLAAKYHDKANAIPAMDIAEWDFEDYGVEGTE